MMTYNLSMDSDYIDRRTIEVPDYPSDRVMRAIGQVAYNHRDHFRKGGDEPYLNHLLGVYKLVAENNGDENSQIAALFHDDIEDVPEEYGAEGIARDFGEDVLGLVRQLSKDNSLGSWHDRANDYLGHLRHADERALEICAADKIYNLEESLADWTRLGDVFWERFNAGLSDQVWWYTSVYNVLASRIPEHPLVHRLGEAVMEFRMRAKHAA